MRKSFHKVQAGRGVNSPGKPEIPEVLFEELLVTALMHQDYLISAPIRIFIFDNRIEIISPGSLPNNLTIEKIRNGNSNIRNPVLVSFIAKGLLPYRGLGSGIKRALEDWSDIDFIDDREGGLFTATIRRKEWEGSEKIISLMREEPELSAKEIAIRVDLTPRAIEKQIASLKKSGNIRRIGAAKGGHWEVNVFFYVNKCGFHIIRIDDPKTDDIMFVFQKVMNN